MSHLNEPGRTSDRFCSESDSPCPCSWCRATRDGPSTLSPAAMRELFLKSDRSSRTTPRKDPYRVLIEGLEELLWAPRELGRS